MVKFKEPTEENAVLWGLIGPWPAEAMEGSVTGAWRGSSVQKMAT